MWTRLQGSCDSFLGGEDCDKMLVQHIVSNVINAQGPQCSLPGCLPVNQE